MVRAGGRSKNTASYADDSDEEAISISSEEEFASRKKSSPKKRQNGSKAENGKSKKSKKISSGRVEYREESDVDFTDAGEMDDEGDSDFEEVKPKKKTPAKRKSVAKKEKSKAKAGKKKKAGTGSRASGRKRGGKPKYASSSDEESAEELEDFSEEEEEEIPLKARKIAKQAKKSVAKKPDLPRVGDMIVTAIKQLRENPRKGSTLAAIKGFMAEEWGLLIPDYTKKIKKYLLQGVESGEIVQTRGKGASGRFTVPGLKVKKRKKSKLTKKWDEEQEAEYEPRKTVREEEKARNDAELELARERRREEDARRAELKASLPKKVAAPRKTEWEVEFIKSMKVVEDKAFYLVKWYNFSKATWEPEENLGGCQDLIDNFLIEEKTKLKADEARRRREEDEGHYEVSRILEVKFTKTSGQREFLIRWKGHGPEDDSWEPEDNLDCPNLIERFMDKFEKRLEVSEKNLREDRKAVERLNYAVSRRLKKNKRGQGFRVTYDGMDE